MRIIAVCAVLLLAACAAQPPPPPPPPLVGTVPVAPAEAAAPAVSHMGTLAGDVEVDISFKLPGRIALLGPDPGRDWREGDRVEAGAVLARLDTAELVETVRAAEARAQNDAGLHERGAKLFAEQLISQQEMDRLLAARDGSAADLRKAQAALADATIAAPFAGTVLRRNARAGETVAAGVPVLRLADLQRLSVEVGVPEQLIGRLAPGQSLSLSAPAQPGRLLAGVVSEVGAAAQAGSRLFRVRVSVANPDGLLRPGMSAAVAIPGAAPRPDAVSVPLSALLADASGRVFHVFTVVEGRSVRRAVEVFDVSGSAALVGGLAPGEAVVAVGAGLCADGALVRVRAHDPDDLYRSR
jgi:RND family efflux transporter MFP subunit